MKTDNNEANNNEGQQAFAIEESARHEGTWLIWPRIEHCDNGAEELDDIEWIWVEIVQALSDSEKVHIIASDRTAERRIKWLLESEDIRLTNIDFIYADSDSFWTRDTGPIFAKDADGNAEILDFTFNAWGEKCDAEGNAYTYNFDNEIPNVVAEARGITIVPNIDFVLEGGAFEFDGHGTIMACKSSVINKNRNPKCGGETELAEQYLKKYFGATNFIWLEGTCDDKDDITDCHIDGLARFFDSNTIVALPEFFFPEGDYEELHKAKNAKGEKYEIVELPVDYDNEWLYINYYIGNKVILLPTCGEKVNLAVLKKISELYPNKEILPIDVTMLVDGGGAIHCITQQQPK